MMSLIPVSISLSSCCPLRHCLSHLCSDSLSFPILMSFSVSVSISCLSAYLCSSESRVPKFFLRSALHQILQPLPPFPSSLIPHPHPRKALCPSLRA